jgi:hypothetical protein
MILPWAHRLISAGAHGLRRIPGQSVNLAHLIWRAPRAPAPLQGHPRWVFPDGAMSVGIRVHAIASPSPAGRGVGVRAYTRKIKVKSA